MAEADFLLTGAIPGVLIGWGAFETLLVEAKRVHAFAQHWQRLERSAVTLHLALPSRDIVEAAVQALLPQLPSARGRLRLNLLARDGTVEALPFDSIFFANLSVYHPPSATSRVCLLPFSAPHTSLLSGVKTTSYAAHALARHWAQSRGYDEGLWLNENGHLIEGVSSNLFLLNDRTLMTPPLTSDCLPGVTRARILSLARRIGLQTEETFFDRDMLFAADLAFLTSSLREIQRVVLCDKHTWKKEPPDTFNQLLAAWADERVRA